MASLYPRAWLDNAAQFWISPVPQATGWTKWPWCTASEREITLHAAIPVITNHMTSQDLKESTNKCRWKKICSVPVQNRVFAASDGGNGEAIDHRVDYVAYSMPRCFHEGNKWSDISVKIIDFSDR